MPAVGVRRDLFGGEGGELVADRLVGLVQAAGLKGRMAPRLLQQLNDPRLHRLGRTGRQGRDHWRQPVGRDPQVGGAEDLALVHRQAAGELAQIFVRQQLGGQGVGLAKRFLRRCGGVERPGPVGGLAQGLGIGRCPGQAVGDMLLRVECGAIQPALPFAIGPHALGHRVLQLGHQHLGLAAGPVQEFEQIGENEAHRAPL